MRCSARSSGELDNSDVFIIEKILDWFEVANPVMAQKRGVWLCAIAHGDFHGLLKNPVMRSVVSCEKHVVLSDTLSGRSASGKVDNVCAGDSVFDAMDVCDKKNFRSSHFARWVTCHTLSA